MRFKSFGSSNATPMLGALFRSLALLACMFAGSHSWAQAAPSWVSLGPAGGSLTTLLADPLAPKTTLYAGSDANGVFLSADVGVTWRTANIGIQVNLNGQRHIYAMASLGNYVYAATDSGVYVSPAGGSPNWVLLTTPRSANPAPACDITLLAGVNNSTLYMAAPCESNVYATRDAGLSSPVWNNPSSLPNDQFGSAQNVSALGVLGGDIAAGTVSAVYLPDSNRNWINSEDISIPSMLFGGNVASLVSSSSKWAFVCTLQGDVFQADLSVLPVIWNQLKFSNSKFAPSSCNGLTVARLNSGSQWVLAMATASGALVSSMYDDNSTPALSTIPDVVVPGLNFSMTSSVNAVLQLNPSGLSNLLWATEFGLFGSSAFDLMASTSLAASTPISLNGPAKVEAPSQRLDNVNVQDVAAIGSSLYAIAQSNGGSYREVLTSIDAGASWAQTGLTTQLSINGFIRSLVADTSHKVLYAGTNEGVFAYTQNINSGLWSWSPYGNSYDVRAMAVGGQALYTGRKVSASNVANSALVVQSLIGGTTFPTIEMSPGTNFNVRALVVSGGSVYAGGGASQDPSTPDLGPYDNAVYVATDFVPVTPLVGPSWRPFGARLAFSDPAILSSLAVGAGQVFAGGDGFLWRCASESGSWGTVIGLPLLNSSPVGVNALASDGATLYVGTAGHGLLALTLGSNTGLVAFNGIGTTVLPSVMVNGLRVLGGRLYVATAAGLATQTTVVTTATGTDANGGGGGCSMAIAGEPDPLLWLLVGIAVLQITFSRRRRARHIEIYFSAQPSKPKDRP